jgi:hypothetical protein
VTEELYEWKKVDVDIDTRMVNVSCGPTIRLNVVKLDFLAMPEVSL